MKKAILCSALLILLSIAEARIWTSTNGQSVEAEVVDVSPNKTVVLKTSCGKTVTVPFSSFIEADVQYLESRLAQQEGLHPVTREHMNALLGVLLWIDSNLWDDPVSSVAKRTWMEKESETDFQENYRDYPLGSDSVFGEPVYARSLYGCKMRTDSLSLFFLNQGDAPRLNSMEMKEQIEATGSRIRAAIESLLGEPERDSLGKDDLRERVWRWDWNGHAIMLSLQEGKYTAVRIMPTERADRGGRKTKLSDDELKQRMASCVERRENGDVVVRNVPMIDQGPKGYCAPATWERYLRYMDIPADMYLLALAANTGIGGTYHRDMVDATENIISSNGRKLTIIGTEISMKNVAKQIDKGLPIMWRLITTPGFRKAVEENTARRNGEELSSKDTNGNTGIGGHICLIIGYNEQTDEIAISDSYGPLFAERWVSVQQAAKVSNGDLSIIKW